MKITKDWKSIHKHISTQCMGLYLALLFVYNNLPQTMQDAIPHDITRFGAFFIIGLGVIGKYVDQNNLGDK